MIGSGGEGRLGLQWHAPTTYPGYSAAAAAAATNRDEVSHQNAEAGIHATTSASLQYRQNNVSRADTLVY